MTKRIIVIGDGIEAWLFAGVTARLLRGRCMIELAPAGAAETGAAALPPGIDAGHRLLAITAEKLGGIGRPRYGITVQGSGGEMRIPHGRYGDPSRGDFIDQWQRLRRLGSTLPLGAYSANAALMAGARLRADADRAVAQSVVAGWQVDSGAYRALLEQAALAQHVRRLAPLAAIMPAAYGLAGLMLADGTSATADVFVDASGTGVVDVAEGWQGNGLRVGSTAQQFDGLEPFGISATLSAAARLVNLLPRGPEAPVLAAEYRRLFEAEREAMAAADAALSRIAGRQDAAVPPLLRHHDDSYRVAGSLPRTGQPWLPDQWLSCFEAIGLAPARYDPNADRFDQATAARDLSRWAATVARSVEAPAAEA